MSTVDNTIREAFFVTGLGSLPENDPTARAARRMARDDESLQVYAPRVILQTEVLPGSAGSTSYVIVPALEEQGDRLRKFTGADEMLYASDLVTHSLGLLTAAHAGLRLKGGRLTAIAPAFTPAAPRLEAAFIPENDLTDRERRALAHYEDERDGGVAGIVRIGQQPPTIISTAFMEDATRQPLEAIGPFLTQVAEDNPGAPPRLIMLRNDNRLGKQAEELAALQEQVPGIVVDHCEWTEDHYFCHPLAAKAVVASAISGGPVENPFAA